MKGPKWESNWTLRYVAYLLIYKKSMRRGDITTAMTKANKKGTSVRRGERCRSTITCTLGVGPLRRHEGQ